MLVSVTARPEYCFCHRRKQVRRKMRRMWSRKEWRVWWRARFGWW